jgi:hypothetical protein
MEVNGNLSKFVDQFNDNPANGGVGMPPDCCQRPREIRAFCLLRRRGFLATVTLLR